MISSSQAVTYDLKVFIPMASFNGYSFLGISERVNTT